jgi:hypothetical protein
LHQATARQNGDYVIQCGFSGLQYVLHNCGRLVAGMAESPWFAVAQHLVAGSCPWCGVTIAAGEAVLQSPQASPLAKEWAAVAVVSAFALGA